MGILAIIYEKLQLIQCMSKGRISKGNGEKLGFRAFTEILQMKKKKEIFSVIS